MGVYDFAVVEDLQVPASVADEDIAVFLALCEADCVVRMEAATVLEE
jgi:hypothetical protein